MIFNDEQTLLDLSPWAMPLGALFSQAMGMGSPALLHRALAEQAAQILETALASAGEAEDEPAPWRGLRTGDTLLIALEDGLALAQFDGSELISLRVETDDGRRWTAIFTGRSMPALGLEDTGPDPELKVALFDDERLLWSHSFYADGRESDDHDQQGAFREAQETSAANPGATDTDDGFPWGAAGAAALGAAVLGAGALLAGKALQRRAQKKAEAAQQARKDLPPPATAPWRVVGIAGPLQGQVFPVAETLLIGRDPTAGIHADDFSTSRRHAELKVIHGCLHLTDLGSSNGTWVGDTQVTPSAELKTGDIFTVGANRFRVEQANRDTPTQAFPCPAPLTPTKPPTGPGPSTDDLPTQGMAFTPLVPTACPRCRKPLPPGARFCGGCGAAVAAPEGPKTCRTCGTAIPEGGRFCPKCGAAQ